jgi:hypothetical protein
MKLNSYSIYDSAAKAYAQPFFVQNDAIALRMFMNMVNSEEANEIKHHPEQFTLFKIGTFDDQCGSLKPMETPVPLSKAIELQQIDKATAQKQMDMFHEEITKIRELLQEKSYINIQRIGE